MTRSERLTPLAKMADKKQQDAALEFRRAQDELARHRVRLDEMHSYREDYIRGFLETGNAGMSAEQMKDYRIFLGKLDAAIRQLDELIKTAARKSESRKEHWVERRIRHRTLEKVVSRYKIEEQRDHVRREDRESDEHTQRGKARK